MSQLGPYFPFYAQDWLGDHKVRALSLAAKGAYIELLSLMWTSATGKLIADNSTLARQVGASTEEFATVWAEIQNPADPILREENGFVYSSRLLRERRKYQEKAKKAQEAGRKGGQAKARNYKDNLADAKRTPGERSSKGLAKGYQSSSSTESDDLDKKSSTVLRDSEEKVDSLCSELGGASSEQQAEKQPTEEVYWNISPSDSHGEYMERVKKVFARLLQDRGEQWAEAYPNYGGFQGIRTEIFSAYQWLEARPRRRKQQLLRFVADWLKNGHDRAGSGARASPRQMTKGERTRNMLDEWSSEEDPNNVE